ncbi:RNA polymerase subunit sigma [Streptomyces inusitatus]|uniref:RNA polymerase subunit sigma n=1 Tax=Streptomyces inusitatus TaxID=68221 RepID=A0A918QJD9_9ACTN|nr:zf-HC2 domain-containing protein [Streptomyces inusitatus]GGZ51822.1 RNA polymerase subunit sigma [Streptomyces inusitatus]
MTMPDRESVHDAVGAYVLGVLDDAEASAFEAHLTECESCSAGVEELSGLEPMLAALAGAPPLDRTERADRAERTDRTDVTPPRFMPLEPAPPGPRVLNGLLGEVAARRAAARRRGRILVAVAAVLIIGGPAVAVVTIARGDGAAARPGGRHPTPAEHAFFHDIERKSEATDSATQVNASVGIERKDWGTHAVLRLKNIKGPLKCLLVAVSKSGEEEIITSWAVPGGGYGLADGPDDTSRRPLYIHGGAAMDHAQIDRFEVRTFDGRKLVEVDA